MTRPPARSSRLLRAARRFGRARAGVAAIEFAFILPVMLLLLMGMSQVTLGLNMDRKLTILSRTVADLVGRARTLTEAEVADILAASLTVMAPYDASRVTIVLSSVVVRAEAGGALVGRVCWSRARNAVARARDERIAIPAGFDAPNSSFVLAETRMPYDPPIGAAVVGSITLNETTAWPVRNSAEVVLGAACLS